MTCQEIRELLPLHVYGDLSAAERGPVDAHLAECPTCRAELAALGDVRRALDASPAVPGVDVSAIYRAESERLRRRSKRWRFTALMATAAAIAFLAMRLDIRADARQLVVRWGEPEPVAAAPQVIERTIVHTEPAAQRELEERINRMSSLIQALAANMDRKDVDQKELARLRRDMADLQQIRKRLSQTEREVSALYTAQFGSRPSGVNP
jgi:hypothetical protein